MAFGDTAFLFAFGLADIDVSLSLLDDFFHGSGFPHGLDLGVLLGLGLSVDLVGHLLPFAFRGL